MRLSGADAPPRDGVHAPRSGGSSIDCARRAAVQRFLNDLPYNTEPPPGRATLRSFRGVRARTARRTASKRRWRRP